MSESKFLKKLASSKRVERENAIEALQKYLSQDKKLSLYSYQKLWKGLFYAMWFCDKPRPQQRLAATIGSLFSDTIPQSQFCNFVEAHWTVMIHEWSSIDHHRIDKFYLMLRRVIGCCFDRCDKHKWDNEFVSFYIEVLKKTVLSGSEKVPLSLPSHFMDVFFDELEKVLYADIDEGQLGEEDLSEKQKKQLTEKITKQKKKARSEVPIAQLLEPFRGFKSKVLQTMANEMIEECEWEEVKKLAEEKEDENDEEEDEKEEEDVYFQ